jgi:hypothetical protein
MVLFFFLILITPCFSQVDLNTVKWISGSKDCAQNKDPFAQVIQYNADTYIIRQNKCLNYEAPFLYLFIGNDVALLVDTGAKSDLSFPLFDLVSDILEKRKVQSGRAVALKVIHSHGHGDHKANDDQFLNKPGVEVVSADKQSLQQFFKFTNWHNESVTYDLGHRELTILPIPGHDLISIAIYDHQTQWLLTGDTVYPGRLYVRDWSAFKSSIDRLLTFCKQHDVSFLLGNHIEMTNQAGMDYPTGTTFQPQEHSLPLKTSILTEIRSAAKGKQTAPKRDVHPDFIIEAVN